jgi:tetratricopeptide (TPR) repeat protein
MKGGFDPVLRRLAALQPTGIATPPPSSTPVTLPRAWTPTATRQSPITVSAGTATPFMPAGSGPSQEQIDAAKEQMYAGNHPEAVLAWDTILRQWPEYAPGLYWRAFSYHALTYNQQSQYEYREYLRLAVEDIDRAIALSEQPIGDYYNLRSDIYASIGDDTYVRSGYEGYMSLAFENRSRAVALGTEDPIAYRLLPVYLVASGRCQEGLAEARRQLRAIEGGDSPSAKVNQSVSDAYRCLGQYSQALEYSTKARAVWDGRWERLNHAIILYSLGRKTEALDILDDLIAQTPLFAGYRYFYRAVIHSDLNMMGEANDDLAMGTSNSWMVDGEAALARALIALDAGDTEYAIEQLLSAEQTIRAVNRSFLDRARSELAGLGVEIATPEPFESLDATPLPSLPPSPEGGLYYATPSAKRVTYSGGTPGLLLAAEGYFAYRFTQPQSALVKSVEWLTVWITPSPGTPLDDFKIYLWKPEDNLWIMYSYEDQVFEIANPSRFILPNGDLYLAAYTAGASVRLNRIEVRSLFQLADGSYVTVGPP